MSAPDPVARLRNLDAPALGAAALAAAHVVLAWLRPDWLLPLVLGWVALAAWHPRLRHVFAPRVLLAITGLVAFVALKDLATPGPFAAELSRLDPAAAPVSVRQPDWPRVLVSLGRLAAILLALPVLRALLARARLALSAALGLALAQAAIALVLLARPGGAADPGDAFRLGEVASRNPASGAFALGALLALAAGLFAWREGRRTALAAFVAAGLCAAAVLSLGSRGGLVALAAGAAFLLYQEFRDNPRRALALGGALLLMLLLLAPAALDRLVAGGESYRAELAVSSLRALAAAPAGGLGLGGFAPGFALFGGHVPAEGMRVAHPDCGWILLLVEWGPLGLAAAACAAFVILRPSGGGDRRPDLPWASAGLAAWAVAALGDISFHREVLLVIGLPLLALRFPDTRDEDEARSPRLAPLLVGLLALGAGAAAWWGGSRLRAAHDPARADDRTAASLPLDPASRHLAGNRALARGDVERAAADYTVAAALEPANSVAIQAYARAITAGRPELALPLWRRLFAGASLRAASLLEKELARPDTRDAAYWLRALPDSPALWILPADSELPGAQNAYERWRAQPAKTKAASRWRAVLGASARWGSVREFNDWLHAAPPPGNATDAAEGADILLRLSRGDLAWPWLARRFPPPAPSRPQATDPALAVFVRAHPDDAVAALRLLGQTESADERIALLRSLVARPDSAPAFRVRLAHELDAAGRRAEALALLRSAAGTLAQTP